jgi:hypothetical protein
MVGAVMFGLEDELYDKIVKEKARSLAIAKALVAAIPCINDETEFCDMDMVYDAEEMAEWVIARHCSEEKAEADRIKSNADRLEAIIKARSKP